MKKIQKISSAVLTAVFAFALIGCSGTPDNSGSDTGDGALQTVTPGKITIATGLPAYEPWVVGDAPENCEGFEAAIGCEIAKRLGFAPEDVVWVRTGFEEAIAPGAKDFDFNLQQYSATPERAEVVDFSSDYAHFAQALVVNADGKYTEGTKASDYEGILIAVANGTTSVDYAKEFFGESAIQIFNDVDACIQALIAGQVDGLIQDISSAYYIAGVELDNGKIVGVLDGTAKDGTAALLAKDSPLTAEVTRVIDEMNADGTIEALQQKWLYDTSSILTITK